MLTTRVVARGAPILAAARPAVPVFVSIGSNIEPVRNVQFAVRRLRERFGPLRMSSVYRSAAAGFDGEDFLNLVVGFRSRESPAVILGELEAMQVEAGRVRGPCRFAPRTLDLDLLLYGDRVIDEGSLQVPRADVTRDSFVLGPLAEIAPGLRHPVTKERMQELWRRFDRGRHPIHRVDIPLG